MVGTYVTESGKTRAVVDQVKSNSAGVSTLTLSQTGTLTHTEAPDSGATQVLGLAGLKAELNAALPLPRSHTAPGHLYAADPTRKDLPIALEDDYKNHLQADKVLQAFAALKAHPAFKEAYTGRADARGLIRWYLRELDDLTFGDDIPTGAARLMLKNKKFFTDWLAPVGQKLFDLAKQVRVEPVPINDATTTNIVNNFGDAITKLNDIAQASIHTSVLTSINDLINQLFALPEISDEPTRNDYYDKLEEIETAITDSVDECKKFGDSGYEPVATAAEASIDLTGTASFGYDGSTSNAYVATHKTNLEAQGENAKNAFATLKAQVDLYLTTLRKHQSTITNNLTSYPHQLSFGPEVQALIRQALLGKTPQVKRSPARLELIFNKLREIREHFGDEVTQIMYNEDYMTEYWIRVVESLTSSGRGFDSVLDKLTTVGKHKFLGALACLVDLLGIFLIDLDLGSCLVTEKDKKLAEDVRDKVKDVITAGRAAGLPFTISDKVKEAVTFTSAAASLAHEAIEDASDTAPAEIVAVSCHGGAGGGDDGGDYNGGTDPGSIKKGPILALATPPAKPLSVLPLQTINKLNQVVEQVCRAKIPPSGQQPPNSVAGQIRHAHMQNSFKALMKILTEERLARVFSGVVSC